MSVSNMVDLLFYTWPLALLIVALLIVRHYLVVEARIAERSRRQRIRDTAWHRIDQIEGE